MDVAGAQARLHVADRNAAVKAGQAQGHHRRGVALHQHGVGRLLGQHRVGAGQQARRQVAQRLVGLHHVQVGVGLDVEQAQHLVEHLTVLGRRQHPHIEIGIGTQGQDDRRHLDGLGARPHDAKNALHLISTGLQGYFVKDNEGAKAAAMTRARSIQSFSSASSRRRCRNASSSLTRAARSIASDSAAALSP